MFQTVWLAFLDGDIDRGERLAAEALEFGAATGQTDALIVYGAQFVNLHDCRGRCRDQAVTTFATAQLVLGHYVARVEHLLGSLDEADVSFARAHQMHERLRAPQFVARTEAVGPSYSWTAPTATTTAAPASSPNRHAALRLDGQAGTGSNATPTPSSRSSAEHVSRDTDLVSDE